MSLWFQPKPRSVLYCDFAGFRVPEMTKRRPVIVLRAHKRNRKLVYVVPLSTSAPNPPQPYHFHFACSPVVHTAPTEAWAKCDMVVVVSVERLSISRWRHASQRGARPQSVLMISEKEFATIRQCVAIAFGFGASSYVHDDARERSEHAVDV
jgi:uncharacterized protein YifN (PemK superfamily)